MLQSKILKKDFPIFERHPELVYLDSAATAQKPRPMLDAINEYYTTYTANTSRGLYPIAEKVTLAIAEAREQIAHFIGSKMENTLFVGNTTQGINLVATGLREHLSVKDNIVVTALEHHSNFLPWKELCQKTGAKLRIADIDSTGRLSAAALLDQIDEHTRVLAFAAVSNVLGLVNPVQEIIAAVRKRNPQILVLVDAAQAIGHIPVSLTDWDADYLVFSGHKVLGPTGIGVLAGKKGSLEVLGAVNVGGGTALNAMTTPTLYKCLPESLEGGTPHIAGIIGLSHAIRYIDTLGIGPIHQHEQELLSLASQRLKAAFGKQAHILGGNDTAQRAGILSFTLDEIHPHDLAHLLGEENICVRAGEHCAQPLHHALKVHASVRISVSVYNTPQDINILIQGIEKAVRIITA